MKKLFQIGAVFAGILIAQAGYAQNAPMPASQNASMAPKTLNPPSSSDYAQPTSYGYNDTARTGTGTGYQARDYRDGANGYAPNNGWTRNSDGSYSGDACPEDHPCEDQPCNDCWCLYCRYEPCYYCTKRCVEEQVPCKKKCCRMCPKYYEVTRCRYVPQYYTETICRQEPEYYEVDDCKTCKRWISERHCKYVPKYYWKHTCGDQTCNVPCPR